MADRDLSDIIQIHTQVSPTKNEAIDPLYEFDLPDHTVDPSGVIQQRLMEEFGNRPMTQQVLEEAARRLLQMVKGYLGDNTPSQMMVRYDVSRTIRSGLNFSIYATHDGEQAFWDMGFRDFFTMNAGAQSRLAAYSRNTAFDGLVVGGVTDVP